MLRDANITTNAHISLENTFVLSLGSENTATVGFWVGLVKIPPDSTDPQSFRYLDGSMIEEFKKWEVYQRICVIIMFSKRLDSRALWSNFVCDTVEFFDTYALCQDPVMCQLHNQQCQQKKKMNKTLEFLWVVLVDVLD